MSVILWNSLVLTWEWSQHTTNFDFCISVIPQWEQHQQSRTHSWELHQSVCCWPLQSCQLWWLFRIGCACKHGVLPADQLHPETGPLPEPAEPKPPQRHMTTWFVSLSAIRGPVLEGCQSITCSFTSLSSSHPSPVTVVSHSFAYLWRETSSWSGQVSGEGSSFRKNQSDNHFSNNSCVINLDVFFMIHLISDKALWALLWLTNGESLCLVLNVVWKQCYCSCRNGTKHNFRQCVLVSLSVV